MTHTAYKKKYWIIAGALAFILLVSGLYFSWPNGTPQAKPEQSPPQERYDYYLVIEESTNKTMAYVSTVTVNIGDEYISEDNKRYIIVKIEENRAYARYVENLNLENFRKK